MTDPRPGIQDDTILAPPMSEHDVAARWQKSVRTLQRWRREGYGPPYLRIGGTIHYRLRDILDFETAVRFRRKPGA